MSKKSLFTLVLVGIVAAALLSACGGGCPQGYTWYRGGENNPAGFCKNNTTGDVVSPMPQTNNPALQPGTFYENNTPVDKVACSVLSRAQQAIMQCK